MLRNQAATRPVDTVQSLPRKPAERLSTVSNTGFDAIMLDTQDKYLVAAQEDRCSPRTKITIPAQLRASGGRAFQTVVHDLSISGFSAAAISRMHAGQVCWITLPGLESLQAEVVWWENSIVGCAFMELLSPIVHDNILQRYSPSTVYRSTI